MSAPQVKKLSAHIFVCTNEREAGHPRGCCKEKGSEALLSQFKEQLKAEGLKGVRAQRAGCLDTCEFGPSVVIYPEGIWYGNVQPQDAAEIVASHLKNAQPVARLRIPGK
ncbi:MAG: (2Fe-2S) ferredoxin domain-containing protein [Bdellovibrionota bacterium]